MDGIQWMEASVENMIGAKNIVDEMMIGFTQKKVISKEEENAPSKFLSQFPLNLRVFLSL